MLWRVCLLYLFITEGRTSTTRTLTVRPKWCARKAGSAPVPRPTHNTSSRGAPSAPPSAPPSAMASAPDPDLRRFGSRSDQRGGADDGEATIEDSSKDEVLPSESSKAVAQRQEDHLQTPGGVV